MFGWRQRTISSSSRRKSSFWLSVTSLCATFAAAAVFRHVTNRTSPKAPVPSSVTPAPSRPLRSSGRISSSVRIWASRVLLLPTSSRADGSCAERIGEVRPTFSSYTGTSTWTSFVFAAAARAAAICCAIAAQRLGCVAYCALRQRMQRSSFTSQARDRARYISPSFYSLTPMLRSRAENVARRLPPRRSGSPRSLSGRASPAAGRPSPPTGRSRRACHLRRGSARSTRSRRRRRSSTPPSSKTRIRSGSRRAAESVSGCTRTPRGAGAHMSACFSSSLWSCLMTLSSQRYPRRASSPTSSTRACRRRRRVRGRVRRQVDEFARPKKRELRAVA